MVDHMDWKAAMDSEVFRNFVAAELKKEAAVEAAKPTAEQVMENNMQKMDDALAAVEQFEAELVKHPEKLAYFKRAKAFLLKNPDALDKVDPSFVEGIMMLNLEDKDDIET